MSPAPRKKPAACEKVGAAVTAVAANAPNSPRRVKPVVVFEPICSVAPSRPFSRVLPHTLCKSSPDALLLLHRSIRVPRNFLP